MLFQDIGGVRPRKAELRINERRHRWSSPRYPLVKTQLPGEAVRAVDGHAASLVEKAQKPPWEGNNSGVDNHPCNRIAPARG